MPIDESPFAAQERAFSRCPLLYRAPGARLVGREAALEGLAERLKQTRLAVIRGRDVGVGATTIANAFAHRHADSYPGGAFWIPYRVSNQKGLAADIIEALDLPAPVSQRYPFVGAKEALDTMWRGLHQRSRTLLVIDGWTSSDTAATWRSATESVHVVAIARPDDVVTDDCLFSIGPPEIAAVTDALAGFDATALAASLAPSALALSLALRLLERGTTTSKLTEPTIVLREAIDSVPEGPRRLLSVLSVLNDQPVPTLLLDSIYRRFGAWTTGDTWRSSLTELVDRGLCASTTFGEPLVHELLLRVARERLGAEADALRAPVVEAVVETLRAVPREAVHAARRLVPHTYALLSGTTEGNLPSGLFSELIDIVSAGASEPLAVIAARKGIAMADAARDLRRKLRHQMALGHSFSQMRQLDGAQETLREALKTAEEAYGPESLECASVIDHLERAIDLGACGDSGPEALALAQRAHAIRERAWGAESPQLRGSLEHVALQLAVRERHAEALDLYQRAHHIAERDGTVDVDLLRSLGMALADNGRFDDALEMIDRVMDLEAAHAFPTGLIALMCAEEVLEKARRTDRFIVYVDRVLEGTVWDTADEGVADRGKVLAMRARALFHAGRTAEAACVAADALQIVERFYGPDHRSIPRLRRLARGDAPE